MHPLVSRAKSQAPPPWVVFEALTEPNRPATPRRWLVLADDEAEPRVLKATKPSEVVWSSLWSDRPRDQIRFELESSGSGTSLRWTLLSPDDAPEPDRLKQLRHRINFLINGELRAAFDL